MKIGLNVFSCSRFEEFEESVETFKKYLPEKVWERSCLHEDRFKQGIEKRKQFSYFNHVQITDPCLGLGHAFCKIYSDQQVKENKFNVHLEEDWVLQGDLCLDLVTKIMREKGLLQVYIVSKKTLEEALERTQRKPDFLLDKGRLGLYIGNKQVERMGHIVPNTTPHIGVVGLFDGFVKKVMLESETQTSLFRRYAEVRTPRRAWKVWSKGLPPYKKSPLRYGFLLQSQTKLIKHIGTRLRNRLNEDGKIHQKRTN